MSSAVFTGDLSSLKWKMQCFCVKTHSHMARDWHINKNLLDNSTTRGRASPSVTMAFPKVVTVMTNHNQPRNRPVVTQFGHCVSYQNDTVCLSITQGSNKANTIRHRNINVCFIYFNSSFLC